MIERVYDFQGILYSKLWLRWYDFKNSFSYKIM